MLAGLLNISCSAKTHRCFDAAVQVIKNRLTVGFLVVYTAGFFRARVPPMPFDNANGAHRSMPVLGDLEVAVLECLWAGPEWTAKGLHEHIGAERGISLNTVQSTLERLHRKQFVERRKRGHAYRYSPRIRREELVAAYMQDMLGRFGGDPAASIAAFVESADGIDEATLERLEAALERRRREENR